MADLVVIVPSRGRPQAVAELAEAFRATCTQPVRLVFAIDEDEPAVEAYARGIFEATCGDRKGIRVGHSIEASTSMVDALNRAAAVVAGWENVAAVAFLGDDHRPRTVGWDTRYLDALEQRPGLVYGNDLIQGANLPTQVAMSVEVVRALGHMAPATLQHLYVDNYWLGIGRAANCITYLPDVIVEHLHPVAGKAQWDAGYARVNSSAVYDRDAAAFARYWSEHGDDDVRKVREALAGART